MFLNKRLLQFTEDHLSKLIILVAVKLIGLGLVIIQVTLIGRALDFVFVSSNPGTTSIAFNGLEFPLVRWTILFTGLAAAAFFTFLFEQVLSAKISSSIKVTFREALFDRLVQMELGYLSVTSTGSVTTTAVEGIESLSVYFGKYLPQLFFSLLAPFILFFYVLRLHPPAAIFLILLVPLIPLSMALVMRAAKGRMKDFWREYQSLSDFFLQSLQGLTALIVHNAAENREKELGRKAEGFRRSTMKVLGVQLGSITFMDAAAFVGAAFGIIFAGTGIARGTVSFSEGIIILLLSAEFFLPLRRLGSFFHAGMNGVAAAEEIFTLFDADLSGSPPRHNGDTVAGSIEEGNRERSVVKKTDGKPRPALRNTKVVFEGVAFWFDKERPLLEDLSFSLSEGETAALVGASGSGKTSIAYLLTRFYGPDKGKILLDGKDIRSISKESIRNSIALVSGNSHIFEGTIRDNLLLAGHCAPESKMIEVLGMAGLGDFYAGLPEGLDWHVGEWGGKLSGGQKQRLAIARALLTGAEFFIFDEATSNVDAENEQLIRETVQSIASIRTALIISHRLEMVQFADRILVLEKGRIAQEGAHTGLINTPGTYNTIFSETAAYQTGKVLTWGC